MRWTVLIALTTLTPSYTGADEPAVVAAESDIDRERTLAREALHGADNVDAIEDAMAPVADRGAPAASRAEHPLTPPKGITLRPTDARNRQTIFRPTVEYQCYTTGELRQLGEIIIDYRYFLGYANQLEGKVHQQQLELTAMRAIDQEHTQEVARLDHALEMQTALFQQERALRLSERAARTTRERYLWLGGGVLLVANAVLVIVVAAK